MQTVSSGIYPPRSTITMLPINDLNPSDYSCIYSVLVYIIDQSRNLDIEVPCITFDQPLYFKAVEIITAKSMKMVCRLGVFHTLMSFLGSIGDLMEGSGLEEALQRVYGKKCCGSYDEWKGHSKSFTRTYTGRCSIAHEAYVGHVPRGHNTT